VIIHQTSNPEQSGPGSVVSGMQKILRLKKACHLTMAGGQVEPNANEIRYGLSTPNLLAQPKDGDANQTNEPQSQQPHRTWLRD